MGIPNKLSPLTGGEDILPNGYLIAEFLENEGNVYLTLPCVSKAGDDISWTFDVQYTQFTTGKQAEGKNGTPYFFCGVTGSEWYWGVNSSILYTGVEADYAWHKFKLSYSKEFTGLEIDDSVFTASYVSENVVLPEALRLWRSYGGQSPCYNRKKQVTVQLNKKTIYELIPCIDLSGQAAFFDKVSQTTFYSSNGALIVGMTPAQARQLSRLPVTAGGTLKVSLPWEAQWDTGVQNALDIAAIKGWTITVQYRDPEIATTNIPISFLENSESGYINTELKAYGDTVVECEFVPTQYNFVNIYYVAGTYNTIPSFFGSLDYNKAYGRRFTFGYGQNKLIRFDGQGGMPGYSSELGVKYKTKSGGGEFYINGELIYKVPVEEFESTTNIGLFGHSWNDAQGVKNLQMYRTKISRAGVKQGDYIPCITQTGVPCFFDRISKGSFYFTPQTEGAILIAGMTISQAWQLSKLPVVETGTLTVSLPWEAQWDTGVQSALSIAAGRGWIITVQYRDPEITTTNIPISFLESTGEQYIKIPYITTADTVAEGSMQFIEFYNTDLVKYAMGTTNYPLGMGWGVFDNNGSAWGWYFSGKKSVGFKFDSAPDKASVIHYKINTQGELWINGDKAKDISPQTKTDAVVTSIGLFGYVQTNGNVKAGEKERHFYCDIFEGSKKTVSLSPVISSNGVPCMHDRITKQSLSNSGTGAFTAGFNAVESARKLATLPDVTAVTDETKKSLTVSLPWEAQLVITGVSAAVQVAVDRGWQITAQYRDAEADNAYYNRYAACTIKDDMLAVNSDYMNDLTYDGSWVYPLPELGNSWQIFTSASKVKRLYFSAPKVTDSGEICETNNVEYVELNVPQCTRLRWAVWRCSKVTEIQVNAPLMTQAQMFAEGCTRLRVFRGSLSKLTDGSNMFHGCQLDKESVLLILNSLPAYTSGSHPITIGIHIDYETDPDVLSAIALADIAQTPVAEGGKGWTVTVQWNGTATTQTTSTYGLRRRPVYAKLSTIELFDGTTETLLDWGHYVTSWEERGYQEFASLEEAEEYFNINQTEEV